VAERAPGRRTARQRVGARAEALVASALERCGWRILARNVRVGRAELDLVALDPGPPPRLVVVEVRSRSQSRFGTPAESIDRAKVTRLYGAVAALRASGRLPDGTPLPRLRWRVDLAAVDLAPSLGDGAGGARLELIREIGA